MNNDFISKIITYEQSVFDEYTMKRNSFLEHLKTINNLDYSQLNIMVHDIKAIIDPIKTSISEIEFYFTNTEFKKKKNIEENNVLFYLLLLRTFSSELSERSESEESVSVSLSERSVSVSESVSVNSSRSVSETFSSK
jgi:hypothetical protein